MRHWSLLGIANYWTKPGRTAGVVLAVALGSGTVLWIHSAYESLKLSIEDQVRAWIGRGSINIEGARGAMLPDTLLADLRALPNIRTACPRTKNEVFVSAAKAGADSERLWVRVDLVGIDPSTEYQLRTYNVSSGEPLGAHPGTGGRLLQSDDHHRCMIEDDLAASLQAGIGDAVKVALYPGEPVASFEIAGRFYQRRVAKFQEPVLITRLQDAAAVTGRVGQLRFIDLVLHADDLPALRATADSIRRLADDKQIELVVETAESRLRPLKDAGNRTEFVLGLISTVALVTAFFIVATTMNMGLLERLRQLGLMRCVGVTRAQLAALWLVEVLPLGIAGAALGIPVGMGLTLASVQLVPEYLQEPALSYRGLFLAVAGGIVTALLSGSVPAVQALRVTPLDATRPQARSGRRIWEILAAVAGVLLIAVHEVGLHRVPAHLWYYSGISTAGTFSLFLGYALPVPLAVRTVGRLLAFAAAAALGVRRRLLDDQLIRSPWRSGAVCFGFMVALALVVSVSVHGESIIAGWDFPKQVPETFVWTVRPVPGSSLESIRALPAVRDATALTAILVHVDAKERKGATLFAIPSSMFVAVEVDTFMDLVSLEFLEGDPVQARARMMSGGAVLVPEEAARQFDLHCGDRVGVTFNRRRANFEIAGVVKSPALDIAAKYFQADEQLVKASSSTLLGSTRDAERHFGIRDITLVLANLSLPQLPPGTVPPLFQRDRLPVKITHEDMCAWMPEWAQHLPEHDGVLAPLAEQCAAWVQAQSTGQAASTPAAVATFTRALREARNNWDELSPVQRFERFREQIILQEIKQSTGTPDAMTGSIRQLKEDIDRDLRHAMRLFTTIPIIGLIVAAVGAGNLMMANVAARIRQIAIIRAVGATRWQVMRGILAEALILGMLGSVLGLAMGMHAARSINTLTLAVWGFQPHWTIPWGTVSISVAVTAATCLVAGLVPARYAARSNVIAAMA